MNPLEDDSDSLRQNDVDPLLIKLAKNIKTVTNGNPNSNISTSSSLPSSLSSLLPALPSPTQNLQTYRRGKDKIEDDINESLNKLNSALTAANGKNTTLNTSFFNRSRNIPIPTVNGSSNSGRDRTFYYTLFIRTMGLVFLLAIIFYLYYFLAPQLDPRITDRGGVMVPRTPFEVRNPRPNEKLKTPTTPTRQPPPSTVTADSSSSSSSSSSSLQLDPSTTATSLVESWELCPLHRDHPDFPLLDPKVLDPHHLTTGFGGGFAHANISFNPSMLTDTGGEFNGNIKTDLDHVPVIMNFAVLAVSYDASLGDFLLMCILDYQYEGRHVQHPDNFKGGDDHYDKDYHYRFHNSRANDGIRVVLLQKILGLHINKYFLCLDSVSGLLLPLTTWEIKHSYLQLHCHYPHFPNKPPQNLTITLLHNTPSIFDIPLEPAVFPSLIDNTPFSVHSDIASSKIHSRFVPYSYPISNLTVDQIKKINLNKFTYELAAPILLPLLIPPHILDTKPELKQAISSSIGGHIHLSICRKVTIPVTITMCSPVLFTNHFLPHIRHFINYHAYLGIDRFYIYDRFGHYRKLLIPYINSGVVVYKRWPAWYHPSIPLRYVYYDQLVALQECRWLNAQKTQYIATHDFDEWMSIPIGSPVPRFPHSCIRYKRDIEMKGALYAYMENSILNTNYMNSDIIKAADITRLWSTNGCHSSLLYLISITLNTMMRQTYIGYHSIRLVQIRYTGESEEFNSFFNKDKIENRQYSLQYINDTGQFPLPLRYTIAYTFNYDTSDTVRSKYFYRPFQPTQGENEVHYLDFPQQPQDEWYSVLKPQIIRFNHYVNWIIHRADNTGERVEDKAPVEIYWHIQEIAEGNTAEVILHQWKQEDDYGFGIGEELNIDSVNNSYDKINSEDEELDRVAEVKESGKKARESGGREGRTARLAKLLHREV